MNRVSISVIEDVTNRRFALMVVELLVVVVLIGYLVTTLLPAIHTSRDLARKTRCANRIRQLGMAANACHL